MKGSRATGGGVMGARPPRLIKGGASPTLKKAHPLNCFLLTLRDPRNSI